MGSAMTAPSRTSVFLFVPNLIGKYHGPKCGMILTRFVGYSRVILAGGSLFYMPFHPKACTWLYIVSCLLDAVDGFAARKFNQATKFGSILDMVTDRCTTSCLLCYLSSAYPHYTFVFQILIALDLASHYMHMYSTIESGSSSHKTLKKDELWILRLYYGSKTVLFVLCAANELFFVALYLLSFPPRSPPRLGYLYGIPLSYPYLLAAFSLPLCSLKQIINVVQMAKAAIVLADSDVLDRQRMTTRSRKRN